MGDRPTVSHPRIFKYSNGDAAAMNHWRLKITGMNHWRLKKRGPVRWKSIVPGTVGTGTVLRPSLMITRWVDTHGLYVKNIYRRRCMTTPRLPAGRHFTNRIFG
jgi:hypothetical protein